MLKRPIITFKVLCALHIKVNIQNPVCQLARFQWRPEGCNLLQSVQNFLKQSCLLLDVTKKLQFLHIFLHWQTSLPFTLSTK